MISEPDAKTAPSDFTRLQTDIYNAVVPGGNGASVEVRTALKGLAAVGGSLIAQAPADQRPDLLFDVRHWIGEAQRSVERQLSAGGKANPEPWFFCDCRECAIARALDAPSPNGDGAKGKLFDLSAIAAEIISQAPPEAREALVTHVGASVAAALRLLQSVREAPRCEPVRH